MSLDIDDIMDAPTTVSPSALSVIERESLDVQITTAKRYPRSVTKAKQRMVDMATLDEDTAKGCFYTLRRKGNDGATTLIEGPSARLAEIVTSCWGNIRAGSRTISEDEKFITSQGVCHDLETNVCVSIEVKRRITNRHGRKFSDDMIATTSNAGNSIAYRNAVFKVVPKAVWNAAYEKAKLAAIGDVKSIGQLRQNCVTAFGKMHVTLEQIISVLGKPEGQGIDDIGSDDLLKLQGLFNAIRDGEATVDDIFAKPETNGTAPGDGKSQTSKLAERFTQKPHPTDPGKKIDTTTSNLPATDVAEEIIKNAPRAPETQEVDTGGVEAESPIEVFESESAFVEAAQGLAAVMNVPPSLFESAISKLRLSGIGGGRRKDSELRGRIYQAMNKGKFNWEKAEIKV